MKLEMCLQYTDAPAVFFFFFFFFFFLQLYQVINKMFWIKINQENSKLMFCMNLKANYNTYTYISFTNKIIKWSIFNMFILTRFNHIFTKMNMSKYTKFRNSERKRIFFRFKRFLKIFLILSVVLSAIYWLCTIWALQYLPKLMRHLIIYVPCLS